MKAKSVIALVTALFMMFAVTVCADETVSAVYPEDATCKSDFFGATPRPDGDAFLMDGVSKETSALSVELYNNFLQFDPGMFLYSDDGLMNYDSLGLMDAEELAYVKQMASEITEGCNGADEKIRAVAEYVALNVCYDYDYTLHGKPAEEVYVSAYDVLTNGSSVCHGYSLSCMALLQSLDIPCVFVRSPNHAWNLAHNGERWILFDTTWMSSGRMENGVLDKGEKLWEDWFDYTIETAASEKNHTIDALDIMIADGKLMRFPVYTQIKCFEIPDGVTEIADYVFCKCQSIEKVIVPDSVVSVGDYVFFECGELECVKLGNNVDGIGYAAFCYCDDLEEINIPDSVKYIDYSAFLGCTDLDRITIPDGVESIGEQSFANCTELAEIVIGDGVKSIGKLAFCDCRVLRKLVIGDGVKDIGENAFANCNSIADIVIGDSVTTLDHWYFGAALESIVIGDGITSIGTSDFQGCTALKEIRIPDSVVTIGLQAFALCTGLEDIKIGDSVISIGENAFYGCSSIKELYLGKNVESISKAAFYQCGTIDSVRIGHKVKSIGYAAFYETSVTNVYYTGNEKDWGNISFDVGNNTLINAKRTYVSNTSVEISDNSFKVECKNIPKSGYDLFVCTYECGRIKNAYIRTVDEITDDVFTLGEGVDTVKVFVLGSDGSLIPLIAGEILEI